MLITAWVATVLVSFAIGVVCGWVICAREEVVPLEDKIGRMRREDLHLRVPAREVPKHVSDGRGGERG